MNVIMKRKVGELNNIPIVEGDPNLLKPNEILHKGGGQLSKRDNTGEIKDLGSGDGGSGSQSYRYYEVKGYDEDACMYVGMIVPHNVNYIIKDLMIDTEDLAVEHAYSLGAGLKYKDITAFRYLDIPTIANVSKGSDVQLGYISNGSLEDRVMSLVETVGVPSESVQDIISTLQENFIEITKELYYSLVKPLN